MWERDSPDSCSRGGGQGRYPLNIFRGVTWSYWLWLLLPLEAVGFGFWFGWGWWGVWESPLGACSVEGVAGFVEEACGEVAAFVCGVFLSVFVVGF